MNKPNPGFVLALLLLAIFLAGAGPSVPPTTSPAEPSSATIDQPSSEGHPSARWRKGHRRNRGLGDRSPNLTGGNISTGEGVGGDAPLPTGRGSNRPQGSRR